MALPKGEAATRPQSWAQTAKGQLPDTEGHRGLAQSADKLEAGAGGWSWRTWTGGAGHCCASARTLLSGEMSLHVRSGQGALNLERLCVGLSDSCVTLANYFTLLSSVPASGTRLPGCFRRRII